MALQIYLIRHGRTEWNEKGLLQGWGDSPLTEQGIVAAKRTGEALANVPFAACYSSLLKRAKDTANYILGSRDIPHFHHQGLNELNFGSWEGMAISELADHPEYQQLRDHPKAYQAIESQGETVEQFYHRVKNAFWEIAKCHQQDGQILIVAHGLTLTLLTAILNGVEWHEFRNPEKHAFVSNTSINIVEVENSTAKLVELNNRTHLE
ncbi:phosphoglycerate mutase [Pasteurellaceae bacterium Orientalotternb1]|nr:phosphoglycerate mutase [Pasteurellaceae bacterium Orientalotternb1]